MKRCVLGGHEAVWGWRRAVMGADEAVRCWAPMKRWGWSCGDGRGAIEGVPPGWVGRG
jgi:hypothetical protein